MSHDPEAESVEHAAALLSDSDVEELSAAPRQLGVHIQRAEEDDLVQEALNHDDWLRNQPLPVSPGPSPPEEHEWPEDLASASGLVPQPSAADELIQDSLEHDAFIRNQPPVEGAAPPVPVLYIPPDHAGLGKPPQRKFRRVYSVTFSHTKMAERATPSSFTRERFAVLLQTRHQEVFDASAREGVVANQVLKVMVFCEKHADDHVHLYAAILCALPYGCHSVQQRMQTLDSLFTSFGTSHTYFWNVVVYAAVPSEHKAPEELDSEPYHSEGRTLREELADIPRGARPTEQTRVLSFLGLPSKGGRKPQKLDVVDLAERIVSQNWHSAAEVGQAASLGKVQDPLFYETVLRMGKQKLEEHVNWVWSLEQPCQKDSTADDLLAKLRAAAESGPCTCQGRWIPSAEYLVQLQGLEDRYLQDLVVRALQLGRRKDVNILIVGEPGAGKSFCVAPLKLLFNAFETRGQKERFPLQGLPGCEICLLQDVRYESMGLCWDDWLRWGDGDTVTINVPRNTAGAASIKYVAKAPLFATMADPFSYPLLEARQTGRDVTRENLQFQSRWRIVKFHRSIPEDRKDITLDPCAKCAANWYLGPERVCKRARTGL